MVISFSIASVSYASSVTKTYSYTQFGQKLASVKLTLTQDADRRIIVNETNYENVQARATTKFVFEGSEFSLNPKEYSFSIVSATGKIDINFKWGEEVTYEIVQYGIVNTIPVDNLLPLSNETIADYAVATWLLSSKAPGEKTDFNLALPIQMIQGVFPLKASVEYIGDEELLNSQAMRYEAIVSGLAIDLWVDKDERLLIKLDIPAQGVSIARDDLEETKVKEVSWDNMGPYNVVERDVYIPTEGGNLLGILAFPEGVDNPDKAVIFVAGSGPTDRDGNNPLIPGKIDNLKEMAHFLASNGIVTLRYDKRGIAGSSQLFTGETPPFSMYKDDLINCVEYLKSLGGVEDKKIYIAGHSEGSTLAIMAGNERSDLAGLILLSGPGFKQAEVLRAQIEEAGIMAEESGAPQGFKTKLLTALNDLYEALRNDTPFDITKYEMSEDYKAIYLSLANQRDFAKEWIDVDPSELLKGITAPVCIIQGDADTQVTVADAKSLAAAIEGEELHIFQGIDHVLKKVGMTPLPYGDPLRRVDGQVLKTILEFVIKN